MVLRGYDDLLRCLLELLDLAASCDEGPKRTQVLTVGLRRLSTQAHYYPLRRLADQWQRVVELEEEAC